MAEQNKETDKLIALQQRLHELKVQPSVLICDDNVDDSAIMDAFLRRHDIIATVVTSGEEAVAHVRCGDFWVVFLDWKLIGMSGVETLRQIKSSPTETMVIIVTGWATKEVELAAFAAGAVAIIQKPLGEEHIKLIFEKP